MNVLRIITITLSVTVTIGLIPAVADAADRNPSGAKTHRQILETALQQFDEAVALQSHGSPKAQKLYQQALNGFETLIHDGIKNGYLYYNVANTYMRLGEIGRAIVNYRRAQRILPGDLNVRRNLDFARSLCEVQLQPTATSAIVNTLFFWHFDTSSISRSYVALTAYGFFWLLLLGRLFSRRQGAVLGWSALAAIVVALSSGISAAWDLEVSHYRKEGVIIADKVTLRKGNGEGYQPQLDRLLPDGVEFWILDTRSDADANTWYHVELIDGKDGWLKADRAEVI